MRVLLDVPAWLGAVLVCLVFLVALAALISAWSWLRWYFDKTSGFGRDEGRRSR